MASVGDESEGRGVVTLDKNWSLVRDYIREELEAFRAKRE